MFPHRHHIEHVAAHNPAGAVSVAESEAPALGKDRGDEALLYAFRLLKLEFRLGFAPAVFFQLARLLFDYAAQLIQRPVRADPRLNPRY